MSFVLVRHRVKDFDVWKPHFDGHEGIRREGGMSVVKLMRNTDDPQEVWVLFEASNVEAARGMSRSDEMRQVMEEAGVIGKPDFVFLDAAG